MKIISLLALLYASCAFAQKYNPPNGLLLKENLYMDATEVSNIHWLEYEHYIRKDSSEEYANAHVPSNEVTKNYRPDYFRIPFYRYFPVVGITHEQAMNYCQWREDVVNLRLMKEGKTWRVEYRLPTEEEWELAAMSIDTLKMTNPEYKGLALNSKENREKMRELFPERDIDFKVLKNEIKTYERSNIPDFIVDYHEPWFVSKEQLLPQHIYEGGEKKKVKKYQHLIGNVAEMVQEKGIVKGGSWRHILATSFPSKRSLIDPDKVYDWVGFRCIAEVIEVEK